MKNSRTIITSLLLAAGLTVAGAIANAEPEAVGPGYGPCFYGGPGPGMMGYGGWGPRGGFGPGMRGGYGPGARAWGGPAANAEARLTRLKAELKITADQESAWQAYEKQARQQAESMRALFAQAPAAAQSAPERLKQRAEFAKQRAAHMEAMSVAVKNLYAVLTPEQQAVADQYIGGARLAQFGPRGYGR